MAMSKIAKGLVIILASAIGLTYAAIGEIFGNVGQGFLFGLIIISVFALFVGIAWWAAK